MMSGGDCLEQHQPTDLTVLTADNGSGFVVSTSYREWKVEEKFL